MGGDTQAQRERERERELNDTTNLLSFIRKENYAKRRRK
jgi:hypothetical protein